MRTDTARRRLLLAAPALAWAGCSDAQTPAPAAAAPASPATPATTTRHACNFILGADVSTLGVVERGGARFSSASGQAGTALQVLRAGGVNWTRLRLWHNPINAQDVVDNGRIVSRQGEPAGGGENGLELTLLLAQRMKAQGLKWLLDFHYSDHWADPGHQTKPAAWAGLEGAALRDALQRYTADVLERLQAQGTPPDMVQIGNEINGGMVWPDGKTWREKPDEKIGGDEAFHGLLKAGITAVREFDARHQRKTPVMLHLALTGDGQSGANMQRVYDGFVAAKLDFDLIGLSWYAYFHDPLDGLRRTLADMGQRYGKPIVVVETAWGWSLNNPGGAPAVFNAERAAKGPWPATPEGQASFVRDVVRAVAEAPEGLGVFWWEPAWQAVPGAGWRTGDGNGWANQTWFDEQGRALPALAALRSSAPVCK
ncbi:MAG: arabinogalactan endo-beta-1,4-galactanase [Rubrivivax sp.]|jgi:arabinogalactan endo-1,4-beta-galactosidase